ncbi:MAG: hypothetical protein ACYC5O_22635 [Anaerolineae bacterium]
MAALRRRDQEVRQGEYERLEDAAVWLRAGIDFEYRIGPDGRRYAVAAHPGMVAARAPAESDAGRSPPAPADERGDDAVLPPGQSLDVSA